MAFATLKEDEMDAFQSTPTRQALDPPRATSWGGPYTGAGGASKVAGELMRNYADEVAHPKPERPVDPAKVEHDEAARVLRNHGLRIIFDGTPKQNANEVTYKEFEGLVKKYNDIRAGRGNLIIETELMDEKAAATFRAGVLDDFATIATTEEGRSVLNGLDQISQAQAARQKDSGKIVEGQAHQIFISGTAPNGVKDFDQDGVQSNAMHNAPVGSTEIGYKPGAVFTGNKDGSSELFDALNGTVRRHGVETGTDPFGDKYKLERDGGKAAAMTPHRPPSAGLPTADELYDIVE